jgi:anaphase-promoting complex subunit 5
MPGRTLFDVFLKHVWEMKSLDSLFELFDRLGDLLARPREDGPQDDNPNQILLSQNSPLGVLVRRARVEFIRLQFDDAIRLWSGFIAYRAPTVQWTKKFTGAVSSGVDIVATEMGLDTGDSLFEVAYGAVPAGEEEGHQFSVDDLERLLELQLDRLQRTS